MFHITIKKEIGKTTELVRAERYDGYVLLGFNCDGENGMRTTLRALGIVDRDLRDAVIALVENWGKGTVERSPEKGDK